MTKSDLVNEIAKKLSSVTKKDTKIIIDTIFESMAETLSNNQRIEIRGFGSFKVKNRRSREGRNPKTGTVVKIPAKKTIHFKVGKELREKVNYS